MIFGIVLPLVSFNTIWHGKEDESSADSWKLFFLQLQWLKYLGDFICCMSILYVLHQFGPYRQYLRAYVRQSLLHMAEQRLAATNDTEKRISDLKTDS